MIYRYLIFFLLPVIFYLPCNAQTHKIEGLKNSLSVAANNTARAGILINLCSEKYSLSADSLYKYATALKKLGIAEANNHYKILADYYTTYSLLFNGQEDSSLAITNRYLEKLTGNAQEQNAYLLFLQLKGLIYYRSNKLKETLNVFYALFNEGRQRNDTLFQLIAKRGISLSYIINGQDQEALRLIWEAVQYIPDKESEKYKEIYGLLSVNAAICFLHLHQASGSMVYADSCEYYGASAIAIGRKTENLFLLCQGLIVNGLILSYKKKIAEAEQKLQEGLAVRKIIGDTLYIISDMSVLASFYANTKQLEKGVAISKKGIELAQRRKASSALLLLLYSALAENYKTTQNYRQYGETLKLEMAIKDSLNKKNSADELNSLQAKYDLQKQENIITQQQLDLSQQDIDLIRKNYWIYASVIFSMLVLTSLFLLFKSYRRKQQLKLKLMQQEEGRKSERAVLLAEEAERKRIAADLHDSLGAYAASIASNINQLETSLYWNNNAVFHELRTNAQAIVSQLSDTIWVLKKDALLLTSISDRVKVFIQKLGLSYPSVTIDVLENISTDYLLPPAQAFHLFQIIKEAVINALKHSHCTEVMVKIETSDGWKISITDNGKGMPVETLIAEAGNGLNNMKERSKESGWKIEWQREKPSGTSVQIQATTN